MDALPVPPIRTAPSPARRWMRAAAIIAANKWDLMKDRRARTAPRFRREPAAPAEVPGLRADPSHLGGDRGAHAEAPGDDREGGRGAQHARAHRRARTASSRRSPTRIRRSAWEPERPRDLRLADQEAAADVRAVHEFGDEAALLVRAFLENRLREVVWIFWHHDPRERAARSEDRGRRAGRQQAGEGKGRARRRQPDRARLNRRGDAIRRLGYVSMAAPKRDSSKPQRCARSLKCRPTCSGPGKRNFRSSDSRLRAEDRGCIDGRTSTWCCASSRWCLAKA